MHKNNKYADDAVMKIGEYYYVSGLYIQAAEWFKKIQCIIENQSI